MPGLVEHLKPRSPFRLRSALLEVLPSMELKRLGESDRVEPLLKPNLTALYERLPEESPEGAWDAALRAYAWCAIRAYLKEQNNGKVLGILPSID